MAIDLSAVWNEKRKWLKRAGFVFVGLASVYYGTIVPRQAFRGIAMERSAGLAYLQLPRHEHWFQINSRADDRGMAEGIVGGVPGGFYQKGVTAKSGDDGTRVVRRVSISLVVDKPAAALERIQLLVAASGGSAGRWETDGGANATRASMEIRIPANQFESVRSSILKLAQRVQTERAEADDVTREYVERDARLRNLRAQENQYLTILKLARTVKDILEISEKLDQVRGDIEKQQSEFNELTRQVEFVAVSLSISKETEPLLFGLPWRPSYEVKVAASQGIEGLIDYATSILAFVFYLPAIMLWMATILGSSLAGWRVLRWGWQFFRRKPKAV